MCFSDSYFTAAVFSPTQWHEPKLMPVGIGVWHRALNAHSATPQEIK
jgi:hypothetical protein